MDFLARPGRRLRRLALVSLAVAGAWIGAAGAIAAPPALGYQGERAPLQAQVAQALPTPETSSIMIEPRPDGSLRIVEPAGGAPPAAAGPASPEGPARGGGAARFPAVPDRASPAVVAICLALLAAGVVGLSRLRRRAPAGQRTDRPLPNAYGRH